MAALKVPDDAFVRLHELLLKTLAYRLAADALRAGAELQQDHVGRRHGVRIGVNGIIRHFDAQRLFRLLDRMPYGGLRGLFTAEVGRVPQTRLELYQRRLVAIARHPHYVVHPVAVQSGVIRDDELVAFPDFQLVHGETGSGLVLRIAEFHEAAVRRQYGVGGIHPSHDGEGALRGGDAEIEHVHPVAEDVLFELLRVGREIGAAGADDVLKLRPNPQRPGAVKALREGPAQLLGPFRVGLYLRKERFSHLVRELDALVDHAQLDIPGQHFVVILYVPEHFEDDAGEGP